MELVVLADTHLQQGIDRLDSRVLEAVDAADAVLHAGDVVSARALDELRSRVPLLAVAGNNDHELAGLLPDNLVVTLEGVAVALVHDAGPTRGRPTRLVRRFPTASLVVFGHSHVPLDAPGIEGQRLFNPGSATQRRSQPFRSFGRLRLERGQVVERRIELLV